MVGSRVAGSPDRAARAAMAEVLQELDGISRTVPYGFEARTWQVVTHPDFPGPSGRDHPRHDDRQPGGRATGQGAGQGSRPGHGQGAGRVRCPDPARARRQREHAGPGPAPWPAALPQAARRVHHRHRAILNRRPSSIEDGSREQGDRSATPVRTIEVGRTRSGSNRRETRMRRLSARLAGTSATRTTALTAPTATTATTAPTATTPRRVTTSSPCSSTPGPGSWCTRSCTASEWATPASACPAGVGPPGPST